MATVPSTKVFMCGEEYLRTSFDDGDREFDNGEVIEKTTGE